MTHLPHIIIGLGLVVCGGVAVQLLRIGRDLKRMREELYRDNPWLEREHTAREREKG